MKQRTSVLATLGTAFALIACGGDDSTDPGNGGGGNGGGGNGGGGNGSDVVIDMQNTAFVAPGGGDDVTVPVGTTITWENLDAVEHDVSSTDVPAGGQGIDSGLMGTGDTHSFTPAVEGTWTYRCDVHPTIMVGATITATADDGDSESSGSDEPPTDDDEPGPGDPGY